MDAAEPPQIVFESPAKCPDGHRVQALLEQGLARARAPGSGWAVAMRVAAPAPGILRAEGEIRDDHGAPVGHRVFERKATACSGLARAIGVWASLVLDAEVHRPRTVARADEPDPPAPSPTPPGGPAGLAGAQAPDGAALRPASLETDEPMPADWPAGPGPDERLGLDREWANRHGDEGRTFEVGAGSFLMGGTGGGLVAGVSPFLDFEAGKGFFLRPAVLLGQSLPSSGPDVRFLATRMDACLRVSGLYTSRNGIQLDLCGGSDLGAVEARTITPYVAFGPSVDLRGELGGALAVMLRGLLDVNIVQTQNDSLATPPWAGRVELALSWRLR